MRNQRGQVVLILVLVMTVALAIGLSVIQRSLSDVSTSSKVEQSSRAFSAAEAGIEKSIQSGANVSSTDLGNNATIDGVQASPIPAANQALEYPKLAKEEMAQVWLADPQSLAQKYNQSSIDIYWGLPDTTSDKPAIELTVIYLSGGNYLPSKYFLDSDSTRSGVNHFTNASTDCSSVTPPTIDTSMGNSRKFYCKSTLTDLTTGPTPTLMLMRARFLYVSASQSFAVQPKGGNCGTDACSLPVQAKIFTSTGTSGQTQRKVQVFRLDKVVPPFFDFAIFSSGDINK